MKSWKTTLLAGIGVLGLVLTQIGYGFDSDPNTTTNWDIVMKAVGTFLTATGILSFGFIARDDSVSDEQAGAGRS